MPQSMEWTKFISSLLTHKLHLCCLSAVKCLPSGSRPVGLGGKVYWFAIGWDCLSLLNVLLCHWPSTKIRGGGFWCAPAGTARLRNRQEQTMKSDIFVDVPVQDKHTKKQPTPRKTCWNIELRTVLCVGPLPGSGRWVSESNCRLEEGKKKRN